MAVGLVFSALGLLLALHAEPCVADEAAQYLEKGTALRIEGKYREAVAAFQKAISHAPYCVDALIQMGAALEDRGNWREAMAAYRRALEVDPGNMAAQRNLEQLRASRIVSGPPRIANPTKESLIQEGLRALEHNDPDRALQIFRLCRGLLNRDPRPLFLSAISLERKGKIRNAIALYEQTVARFPSFAPAWTNLVIALYESGDHASAGKRAQEAVKALPDDRGLKFLVRLITRGTPIEDSAHRQFSSSRTKAP